MFEAIQLQSEVKSEPERYNQFQIKRLKDTDNDKTQRYIILHNTDIHQKAIKRDLLSQTTI